MLMHHYPKRLPGDYVGYAHSIGIADAASDPIKGGTREHISELFYFGITKRHWLVRMREHFNAVNNDSHLPFHRAWRQYLGRGEEITLRSEVVVDGMTYEQAMEWEKVQVDKFMETGNSLNAIPGGFKGLRFLHEHRVTASPRVSLKEREMAVERYIRANPRLGVPNLLISRLWKDEAYAAAVICGVEGRLSVDQVRRVRELNAFGIPADKIMQMVGARNLRRVQRVLEGETYARIH